VAVNQNIDDSGDRSTNPDRDRESPADNPGEITIQVRDLEVAPVHVTRS